jgi:hypothetical protein
MSARNPALTALNKQVCSYDYDPSDARCHARKKHKIDRDSHHFALPRCTPAITPNCGAKVTLADKIVVPVDKLHRSRFFARQLRPQVLAGDVFGLLTEHKPWISNRASEAFARLRPPP